MRENLKKLAIELRDPVINERFQQFIIGAAVDRYYKAVESARKGKRPAELEKNIETAKGIVRFFRSEDFIAFSVLDGEACISRMRKHAGTTEYVKDERMGG